MTSLLAGTRVLAMGAMADRSLAHFLTSFGASVEAFDERKLSEADFLIDDAGLIGLERLGIRQEALEAANPKLIHASVTPFGSVGPLADWKGGELIASAASGVLRLTGTPDRAPVKEALNACTFHADMVAAAGMMSAYFNMTRTGRGQHVDVSIQEVAFNRNVNSILVWQFDKRKLNRVGAALNYGRATVKCIWELSDGWCFHSLMTGRFGAPANKALSDWIDEAGLPNPLQGVDWLSYNRSTLPADTRAVWEEAIARFFKTRTKEEIRTEGRERGINACIIATPEDVLKEPHLEARDFWQESDGVKVPKRFVGITDGPKSEPAAVPVSNERPGPLSGVKVLDFSWALVGSITTKTLGDLGAEVIKVESASRPCLSRIDVQVGASKQGDMDDKPWFAHLNSSKKSLAIDLKRPESREVINGLVKWADLVVENFSPGTMAKLGLGYEDLKAMNPDIIMVSGSVYGQSGPLSQEWGVDGTGGALSGRTYLTGYKDSGPLVPGAVPYGDVIVPYVMAAAASVALNRRQTSGGGAHIDASMYEICVQQMREAFLAEQTGHPVGRCGNDDLDVYFQDVLPCAGEDRWVAISCRSENDYNDLIKTTGDTPADWTRKHTQEDAEAQLQSIGISASAVKDIEDLLEHDPQLAARGALTILTHKKLGPFGHVRTPITFSVDRPEPFAAPNMGEHCEEVASHDAGLSQSRVQELKQMGIFK